ncbi:glycosyl transferase family 2 [Sulfurimicrobium lacus]|uniref:Glycosyl transferase family 2 n=1 Tax=Sulfurimicrobium lacus TaxID=2715678 RepID=A0A6F8VER8_9PROT|nr:glycosyltransferase [Sulfurimicrobium lacus]BCB27526.1 glycosyl transferase family 2 [Sulfurimicrobium lacus]
MSELLLRLEPTLGHAAGPVPADLAEGFATDGAPLVLQHDPILASLPPPPPAPAPDFDWGQALASLQSALSDAVPLLQWFFLLYFIAYNGSYILFNLMSLFSLLRYRREQEATMPSDGETRDEFPVSLIVPVFNQASAAVAAVRAMQHLDYSVFEIIIVNDGSDDETLDVLLREFSLAPFPEAYRDRLQTRHVKSVYASTEYPNMRLVDKEKTGRADALNAAINCARYPLYCSVDVGHVLQRDSLRRMARPFADDPLAVAACSAMGAANGAVTKDGFIDRIGLPRNMLALFQVVEQLRAFLPGRAWWSDINAMLVLPGAFAVFRKETVVAAGAYRTDVADAEMELLVRLHRLSRKAKAPYRITLVPDTVCWAPVPEKMHTQKIRQILRQRALHESLKLNLRLLFSRTGGAAGALAFPFLLLFEWLGPLIELLGYVAMTALWLFGAISLESFWTFMLLAIGLGMLLSVSGVMLDEMSSRTYPRLGSVLKLFAAALLENFGYRQLTAFWRVAGLLRSRSGSAI